MKHINVPQFEGLSIEDLLSFGSKYEEVMEALPMVSKEIKKLPRQYIANVINTLVPGVIFKQWIDQRINDRNDKLAEPGEMIEMDPEIAQIYRSSTEISCK